MFSPDRSSGEIRSIRRLIFSACALSLLATLAPRAVAQNEMAINMSFLSDFAGVIYADALKQRRDWVRPVGGNANTNDNGHPLEAASAYLTGSYPMRAGTYRVYHNGDFTFTATTGTISAFTTDPGTGLKVATWVLASRATNVQVSVSNVVTPATVFAIMRPIAEGSTESHPITEMADRKMVSNWGPTSVVRYMDPLDTNGNESERWANRVRPNQWPRYVNPLGGDGMPWEHVIKISNDTNTSPWINLPVLADDDYIRKVALTFRYGSDGANPFTSDTARETHRTNGGTVWEPLAAHLKVYTEFSNEIWNSNASFPQTALLQNAAVAEAAADPSSPLLYDGLNATNSNYTRILQARAYVRRAVFISDAFRAAFGDAAMMTRVRPMLFWQQNNANSHGALRLAYLNDFYGRVHSQNAVARPANYFFYAAGAASYYSPGPDSSVTTGGWDGVKDIVWDSGDFNAQTWSPRLITDGGLARANGLRYFTYEGGPGLGDPNGTLGDFHPYATEIINDPRIYDEMFEHHRLFNAYGGDLFNYFTHQGGIGSTRWGFTLHLDDPIMPKMRAYHDLVTDPRGPETYGTLLPATLVGGDFSATGRRANTSISRSTPAAANVALDNGAFALYDVRATAAGTYQLVIKTAADAPTVQLVVTVDGKLVGIVNPAIAGSPPIVFDVVANRRLGVKVSTVGGSATLTELAFTATTAVPASTMLFPASGTTFAPGRKIFAAGAGKNLAWQASGALTATGTGDTLVFDIPGNAPNGSTVTLQLSGDNGSVTRTFNVVDLDPAIATTSIPTGTAGFAYSTLLTATGADSALTWTIASGTLPPGVTLGSSGTLTGTPLIPGNYAFTVRVADDNGDSATQAYSLPIAAANDARNVRDDLIVLEAEHAAFANLTEWETGSDSGAVGGFFIQETTGANQSGSAPSVTTANRVGTYRFNVTTAGSYRFFARMRVPVTGNSIFYRLNGGIWISFNDHGGGANWSWVSNASQLHVLSPGTNLLEVVAREANSQFDRFVFQLSGTPAPTGDGPAESPLASLGTPPAAPASLSAGDAPLAIDLSWPAVSGATSYTVKRASSTSGPFLVLAPGLAGTAYTDSGLTAGTSYTYVVAANSAAGSSANSSTATATALSADPTLTRITSPASGTTFSPLQSVTLQGTGLDLNWHVTGAATATGTGETLAVSIPIGATHNSTVTATLTGTNGTSTRTWTIVDLQPTTSATTFADGLVNTTFGNTPLSASGGDGSLTWSITSGALPAGMTLSSAGVVGGTPTESGTFNFTAQVADADGDTATRAYSLVVAAAPPATVITGPADGTTFSPLQSVTVTGTGATLTWNVAGAATATGSGTSVTFSIPGTAANNSTVTATLTGAGGTASRTWTVVDLVPTITTTTLNSATVGQVYPSTSLAASSGNGSLTWSIASGSLPAGISLSSAGALTGTPTATGTSNFTVQVADADGDTATRALTLNVLNPAVTLVGWNFTDATDKGTAGAPSTTNVSAVLASTVTVGPGLVYNTGVSQNLDGMPASRANSTSVDETDYFQWTLPLAGTNYIAVRRVVFGIFHGDTGLTSLRAELRFSTDGFATSTTVPLSTSSIAATSFTYNNATTLDVDLSGYSSLQNLASGTVTFRVYVWGMSTQFRVLGIGRNNASGNGLGLRVEGVVGSAVPANSVPDITTTTLSSGKVATAYGPVSLAATGGDGALTWSLASGALPAGLTLSSAGSLSGTPTESGTFNITVKVADADGNTGPSDEDTQALSVAIAPLTALESWRNTYFGSLAATGNAAPGADPDGDALVNLLEYALDLDPLSTNVTDLPQVSVATDGTLSLTYTPRRSDVTYAVQAGSTLAGWTTLATNPGTIGSPVTITDTDNGPRRFMRLRVTAASDSAATLPEGRQRLAIPAGPSTTYAGHPLPARPVYRGTITGASGAVLTVAGTPFASLNLTSSPFWLRVLTGSQTGRCLLVTANTANTITLDLTDGTGTNIALDHAAWSVNSGDRFEIAPADTLASLFGGVLTGGSSLFAADTVSLWDGTRWVAFYYHSTQARWLGQFTGMSDQSTRVIRPEEAFILTRRSGRAALALSLVGTTPDTRQLLRHPGAVTRMVTLRFPVDLSLGQLSLGGWTSANSLFSADTLSLWDGTRWIAYWRLLNGEWRRQGDTTNGDQSAVVIPAGSAVSVLRRQTASGASTFFTHERPYADPRQ